MDLLLNGFLADPLYYIGTLFAFVAGLAFLVFLRGFLSGFPNLITISGHAEWMMLHRTRAMWGPLALFALIIVWEFVKWVASWFGVLQSDPTPLFFLVGSYIVFGIILWACFALTKTLQQGH